MTGRPGGSSAFDRAQAIEASGFANALSDHYSNVYNQAYEQERQRQTIAAQQEIQRFQNVTLENLRVQQLPRMIEQMGLDSAVAEFSERTRRLIAVLQMLSGVSQPALASNTTERKQGNILQPLDAGGMVAGFLAPPTPTA